MKIGIYGGSFNPIHYGHIGLAQWVLNNSDLDEVWMMLSPANPLKDPNTLADEQKRLREVKQAIQNIEGIRVSDIELQLPRPSYTIQTLRYLQEHYPKDEFSIIIGEDNLAIIDQWKQWEEIVERYRIFVYPRIGYHQIPAPQKGRIVRLSSAPIFDISSTSIRKGEKGSGIKK